MRDAVLDAALIGPAILAGTRHNVSVVNRIADTASLQALAAPVASGGLPTATAGTYPPEQAAEANRRQATAGVRGRLLILF
jgi:hypothetical protein